MKDGLDNAPRIGAPQDFRLLNSMGVVNAQHLNSAIYPFKLFEHASLHYADPDDAATEPDKIGLWDHTEVLDR
jgi:hypothetical protein